MSAPSSCLIITLDSLLAQGLPVWSTFHVTVWMGNYHPLLLNPYLYIRVSGSRRSGLLVLRVVGRYNERGKCLVHYRGHCTLFCWMFFIPCFSCTCIHFLLHFLPFVSPRFPLALQTLAVSCFFLPLYSLLASFLAPSFSLPLPSLTDVGSFWLFLSLLFFYFLIHF